jgi:microcystin-dependent protein
MISSNVYAGDVILASDYNKLRDDMAQTGLVIEYGGASAPAGWLICDGAVLDTTTYSDLFAIIGYSFGGAGANFSLPDLRDTLPLGKSGTKALGSTGGASTRTLNSSEMPGHTHSISEASTAHDHTVEYGNGTPGGYDTMTHYDRAGTGAAAHTTSASTSHVHGSYTGYEGGAGSYNILPAYVAINFIIKY